MITIGTYNKLASHGLPEMLRVPLDGLILQVAAMTASNLNSLADSNSNIQSGKSVVLGRPDTGRSESTGKGKVRQKNAMNGQANGAARFNETCRQLLQRCPDPPPLTAIESSEAYLISLQALRPTQSKPMNAPTDAQTRIASQGGTKVPNTEHTEHGFELTSLGKHLAALPCDPKVGRLLIYGALLSCLRPVSSQ